MKEYLSFENDLNMHFSIPGYDIVNVYFELQIPNTRVDKKITLNTIPFL